jgi:hypothetical protein
VKTVAEELSCHLITPFGARRFYSYGDSAGLAPDFPFNPDVYRRETKSAANVMELWEEQKNVLFTRVVN